MLFVMDELVRVVELKPKENGKESVRLCGVNDDRSLTFLFPNKTGLQKGDVAKVTLSCRPFLFSIDGKTYLTMMVDDYKVQKYEVVVKPLASK